MNVEFRHLRPSFSLLECSHTVFRISAAIDATISHFLSWMTFRDQGSNELISNMFYRFLFDYFSSCESLGTMMPRLHSSCPGCTQQKRRSSPSQSIKVTGLATRPGPGSKFNFNDPSRARVLPGAIDIANTVHQGVTPRRRFACYPGLAPITDSHAPYLCSLSKRRVTAHGARHCQPE